MQQNNLNKKASLHHQSMFLLPVVVFTPSVFHAGPLYSTYTLYLYMYVRATEQKSIGFNLWKLIQWRSKPTFARKSMKIALTDELAPRLARITHLFHFDPSVSIEQVTFLPAEKRLPRRRVIPHHYGRVLLSPSNRCTTDGLSFCVHSV